jgi:hypothetical protein
VRHIRAHVHAERPQVIGDDARGARLPIPQLRVLVDVATPRHHLRHDLVDAYLQRGGGRKLRVDRMRRERGEEGKSGGDGAWCVHDVAGAGGSPIIPRGG